MTNQSVRGFRKNAMPSYYNLRFKPSNGVDQNYIHHHGSIAIANDPEPTRTNRDPTKFNYSANLFRNDYLEWRMRGADYIYQTWLPQSGYRAAMPLELEYDQKLYVPIVLDG